MAAFRKLESHGDSGTVRMVLVRGFGGARVWSGRVEDEGREIHGDQAVEANDSGLPCVEREDHVPNGGGIEGGKSGPQASWGPVQDGDRDDVREPGESAKEQAPLGVEFLVGEVGWDGGGGGDLGWTGGGVESHHVRHLSVKGESGIVKFVAKLSLAKSGDWLEVIL